MYKIDDVENMRREGPNQAQACLQAHFTIIIIFLIFFYVSVQYKIKIQMALPLKCKEIVRFNYKKLHGDV